MPFSTSPRKADKPSPRKLGNAKPQTARDIMLDPHGVYGTRTASRLVAARRRRNGQTALVVVALLGGGALWTLARSWPRAGASPQARVSLPDAPASAPIFFDDARGRALLVPLGSGSVWRVGTENGEASRVWSGGAPASATPLGSGSTLFLPCADGFLRAVNARSGAALWGTRLRGTPVARPVVVQLDAPIVVAGDDSGVVTALDARTGKARWRRALNAPLGSGLKSVATLLNGAKSIGVLVPLLDARSKRGGLVCLDARTGRVAWRYGLRFGAGNGASQTTEPAVVNGGRARVLAGSDDGSLAALSASDGKRVWKRFVGASRRDAMPGEAIPLNGVLLRGAPETWTNTDGGSRVAVGGSDGLLRAFDAETGALAWTFQARAPILNAATALLLPARNGLPARTRLLVAPDEARVLLLDASNGVLLREFALDAPACGSPLVEGRAFWVATRNGVVLKFALPDD